MQRGRERLCLDPAELRGKVRAGGTVASLMVPSPSARFSAAQSSPTPQNRDRPLGLGWGAEVMVTLTTTRKRSLRAGRSRRGSGAS